VGAGIGAGIRLGLDAAATSVATSTPSHSLHITTPPSGSVSNSGPGPRQPGPQPGGFQSGSRFTFPPAAAALYQPSPWEGTTAAAAAAPATTTSNTINPPPPKHKDPPSSPSITSSVDSEDNDDNSSDDDDDDDNDEIDPIVGSPTRLSFHDAPDYFSNGNNADDPDHEIDTFVRDLDRYSVAYLDTIGFVEDEDGQISRDERENGLDSEHQWPVQVFPLRIKGTPTPRLSDNESGGGGDNTPAAPTAAPTASPNMYSPDVHVPRPVMGPSSLHGSSFHSSVPSSTRNSAMTSYSIPRDSAESNRRAPSSTLSASSPALPEIKHVSPFDPRLPPDYHDDACYSRGGYFDDYDSDNDEYYAFSDIEGEGSDDGEFLDLYHASAKQTAKEDAAERASREAAAAAAAAALGKKKPKRGLKRLRMLPSRKNTNPEKDAQHHHHLEERHLASGSSILRIFRVKQFHSLQERWTMQKREQRMPDFEIRHHKLLCHINQRSTTQVCRHCWCIFPWAHSL
jgi:hypothetical protein